MTNQNKPDDDNTTTFERTVKEFGNGGHITLPGEFVGEDVRITTIPEDQSEKPEYRIQPPITIEKIESTLEAVSGEDFRMKHEEGGFPREGVFQYRHDVRLTVDVELVHEAGEHPRAEEGTIVYLIHSPTDEEIEQYAEWPIEQLTSEMVYALEPSVDNLFEHPITVYNDLYQYTIQWNGSAIESVRFGNRSAKRGRFYWPVWEGFSSLDDYRSSLEYKLAVALSEAPQEDYDQYLEAMDLDETMWGEENPLEFDREAVLKRCKLYQP